jgi:signal transduction histidine kinase
MSGEGEWGIFWDRIVYIGVVFIPISVYHFGLAFTKSKNDLILIIGYLLSFIFLILSRTDLFVADIYKYSWGIHTKAQLFHHIFLIYFAIYIFLFFFNVWRFRHNTSGLEKKQSNYILFAFFVLNLSSLAFLPAYGIDFPPLSYLFAVICVLILSLAVTKYHLFETKVILTETLVSIMGIVLFVLPFLMPTTGLKVLTSLVFVLFCFFGYYLIKITHRESRRREDAEAIASRERALRREAEILAADLKRLDTAKTQFLLSTQHHLRGPLSVIQGYLSMIGEGSYGKIPKKAKEKIDASLEADRKLIHLVDELLDVAHFQMNKGAAAKEPVNVVDLVAGAIDDLKTAAAAKELYLNFKKPSVPIPLVSLNARGIREAIYNIVDNAIKYTQTGGVAVSMSVVDDRLRISVKDTGIGIDEKDLQGLFGRIFERGEKAKSVNIDGKGIGLYLSAQIIANNGGNIRVESKGLGEGSEFIIDLPMQTEE